MWPRSTQSLRSASRGVMAEANHAYPRCGIQTGSVALDDRRQQVPLVISLREIQPVLVRGLAAGFVV